MIIIPDALDVLAESSYSDQSEQPPLQIEDIGEYQPVREDQQDLKFRTIVSLENTKNGRNYESIKKGKDDCSLWKGLKQGIQMSCKKNYVPQIDLD